ncbi:MAG: MFS transporter [Cytophagaceae bacterium]
MKRSFIALDFLNFVLADVRYGIGGFLAVYLLSTLKWDPAQIGIAMSAPSLTAILFQSPAGALVDATKYKRLLLIVACILLASCCLAMVVVTGRYAILTIQCFIGIITTIYMPAITAITLGMSGNKLFPKRMGRNETFNHAGNVTITVTAGLIGYFYSYAAIFYLMTLMCMLSIIATLFIREKDIDHALAREARGGEAKAPVTGIGTLFADRNILFFTIAVVLFYFANGAMFPILAQMLALGREKYATLYTSAGITIAELVMVPVAAFTGYAAYKGNRKYLFMIAFMILPVRGLLYTGGDDPFYLLSIQTLDGVAAGIVKVISVVMIADLTRGTGRFNFMQGSVVTAIGIGTSLSDYITGTIVSKHGYETGFIFLACIGAAGMLFFWKFVPETKDIRKYDPVPEAGH